jgi:hypothetical protein
VGGTDTFRGCSFQAAYCVRLALDVLEGAADALLLEGDADVVDAAMENGSNEPVIITQAKTKAEPYVWTPKEVADVLVGWLSTEPVTVTSFEFVTDGSLGPGVASKLDPALHRLVDGAATSEDTAYLTELGLDPAHPALQRVVLRSRLPDGRTLLEQATLRVLQLRERVAPVSTEEGRDLVWRLFGEMVLGSGEAERERRKLSRNAIGELLGIPIATIDDVAPWSNALEAAYRDAVADTPARPEWVLLDLVGRPVPALALIVELEQGDNSGGKIARPADSVLDRSDDVLLVGPAGSGKTTTLMQLQDAALTRGLLPIYVKVPSYLPHVLERLVRRSLETALERPLAPGTVGQLLGRRDVVVIIDGAGELPAAQRSAFLEDLSTLRLDFPEARLLLAARDPASVSGLRLTSFELQHLERVQRREIASEIAPDREDLVTEIEERLGGLVDNPLMFMMALSLGLRDIRPRTRADLFDDFVAGLQARQEGRALTPFARHGAEVCCFELRNDGRYNAPPWWWLERLAEIRDQAIERGILAQDAATADETLDEITACGLVRSLADGAEIGLLHDLFCDWLASEAISHDARQLPDPASEPMEEAVVFLAERDALGSEQLCAVAGNVVAACRAADALPARVVVDLNLAQDLWDLLSLRLAPSLRETVTAHRVAVGDGTPLLVWLQPDTQEDGSGPLASPATCIAVPPVSELSLVVDLWLAVLRLSLLPRGHESPIRVSDDQGALAAQVAQVVADRAGAFDALIDGVAPGLAERARRAAGPRGIRGEIFPAHEYPGMPGTDQVIVEHPFNYERVAEGVRVVAADAPADQPRATRTTAERFVDEPPEAAARQALVAALTRLLPRLDD